MALPFQSVFLLAKKMWEILRIRPVSDERPHLHTLQCAELVTWPNLTAREDGENSHLCLPGKNRTNGSVST